MARRGGVEVEEFGIFFPPRLYKRRMKGGWNFTINLLPLGGFVKMKGEHDTDTEPGSFGAATLSAKTKIMAAGVVMNLIVAFILLTMLALIGMPKLLPNQYTIKTDTKISKQQTLISYIEPNSPAARAGLHVQDNLTAIGLPGHQLTKVVNSYTLPNITQKYAGDLVEVVYTRNGHQHTTDAQLITKQAKLASEKTNDPKGYLGIEPVDFTLQRSTWSAPIVAVGFSVQATVLTFQGLGHALGGLGSTIAGLVTNNTVARQHGQTTASSQVSGPVGIFFLLKDGSILGWQFMIFIIAVISLTLAIMNILPIPALDGGRLWITLVARGLKRPLSPQREEAVNAAGFAVLMVLVVLVTIVDLKRHY